MLGIMTIFVIWGFGGHGGDEERRGKRAREEETEGEEKGNFITNSRAAKKNLPHLGQIRVKLVGGYGP
jgi:hypothetical protein